MADITFKQEEAKTIRFTVTSGGNIVNLLHPLATLRFEIKKHKRETSPVITKVNADFDITLASTGVVTVPLSTSDLDLDYGDFVGELMITFTAANIDKSADITIEIQRAVII